MSKISTISATMLSGSTCFFACGKISAVSSTAAGGTLIWCGGNEEDCFPVKERIGDIIVQIDAIQRDELRDDFAGRALTGLLAGSPDADCGPEGYAHDAYSYANAMLKAREASHE